MRAFLKKNKFFTWIFVIIVILVTLNFFQKEIKNFFYWFSSPIQEKLWVTGDKTSNFFEGIIKISFLKKELDLLNQEKQNFAVKISQLEKLKEENEVLRGALGINLEEKLDLSFASIVSKSPSEDLIFINKGSVDGLSEGMPVITEQKILIGRLTHIYKNYSAVSLASKKGFSFDVRIQGEKDVTAIAKGDGRLDIFLELIPREENVKKEDIVFTSSLGGAFPGSILVGKIKEIIKKDAESFQKAKVETAFNLEELNYLFIITNFEHD